MSLSRRIKAERKEECKRLKKLRKARDTASLLTIKKTKPYKLSMVKRYFSGDIDIFFAGDLAYLIYKKMPGILNRPSPPIVGRR